jgi:hypothetical protein
MIVSIPTSSGMVSVCLNAFHLKLIAVIFSVFVLLAGYTLVQLTTFILTCSPEQFVHIVLFTAFIAGIVFVARFLFKKKAGVA